MLHFLEGNLYVREREEEEIKTRTKACRLPRSTCCTWGCSFMPTLCPHNAVSLQAQRSKYLPSICSSNCPRELRAYELFPCRLVDNGVGRSHYDSKVHCWEHVRQHCTPLRTNSHMGANDQQKKHRRAIGIGVVKT